MRIGIISLIHESNTFAVTPTTMDSFRRYNLLFGNAIREKFAGGLNEISGFFAGLEAASFGAVPIFYASTPPSGTKSDSSVLAFLEFDF